MVGKSESFCATIGELLFIVCIGYLAPKATLKEDKPLTDKEADEID